MLPDADERFLDDLMGLVAVPGQEQCVPEEHRLVPFKKKPERVCVGGSYLLYQFAIGLRAVHVITGLGHGIRKIFVGCDTCNIG